MEASRDDLTFTRTICNIFKEVTGVPAVEETENFIIQFWNKRGWSAFDFRLVIEFEFNDPRQKEFYSQPGNLNLRMMLNPRREARLTDILIDLKSREARKQQQAEKAKLDPKLRMKCGTAVRKEDYDQHLKECFELEGGCFGAGSKEFLEFNIREGMRSGGDFFAWLNGQRRLLGSASTGRGPGTM